MSIDPALDGVMKRTKEQVAAAVMPDDSKDRLYRLIDKSASATNGTPDKIQIVTELMLESILLQAAHRIAEPALIEGIVDGRMEKHSLACPLRADPSRSLPRWAATLFPFRWQLCIALSFLCFSPQFPAVMKTAYEMLK